MREARVESARKHSGWQRLFCEEVTFIWVNCDFQVQRGRSLGGARVVMVKLDFVSFF